MINYKDFLKQGTNKKLVVSRQEDGSVKHYSFNGAILTIKKFEVKPKIKSIYFSRYLTDKMAYKEFDMATFIQLNLNSLSHYIVKELPKDTHSFVFLVFYDEEQKLSKI